MISLPAVIAFVVGAVIGSFLNVCIHRLPRKESIVFPASHCPTCATPLRMSDNIPLLSFVLLWGRCRTCRAPISLRYPIVELANGLGYALILWRFGLTWTAVAYAVLFSLLLIVTGTDLRHQIIPDRITLPGLAVGLAAGATILPIGWVNSVLGALVGGGILLAVAWISPYLFGKEGMGGGDIKLLAMVGAFLGWQATVLTILIGAVTGSIAGLLLIFCKVIRRDQYVPFGPFLAFGAVISLFFHQDLFAWYLRFMGVR